MFKKDEQNRLLNAVAEALGERLTVTFGRAINVVLDDPQTDGADAELVLVMDGPLIRLDVEVQSSLTPATVAAIGARGARPGLILFTPRLTAGVLDACRRLGLNCADADGNLFLRTSSTAVDIQGRPAGASRVLGSPAATATRLTSRSGLQIVFVLLAVPELRDEPFRALAAASGTSLGSVAGVIQELTRRRFVASTSRGRSLYRTRELLDEWVDGYRLRLFARLRLGSFSADAREWWRTSSDAVGAVGGQWGGETALWARGRNLRPARGVLYVDELPLPLISALHLRRDQRLDAPVELRRRFWATPISAESATVPAPLIYADLLADGDPRLVEAAAELRKDDDDLRRLDES